MPGRLGRFWAGIWQCLTLNYYALSRGSLYIGTAGDAAAALVGARREDAPRAEMSTWCARRRTKA